MPIMRTYGCPDCGGRFRHLHMTREEAPPAACELCGADMEDAQPELPQVNIGGSATDRAVKLVYNQLEQTQGITDLKDNLREGDVAAPSSLPRNPVTQFAAETGHQYFQGSSVSVPEAMAGARQGANESAGIMKAIQQKHMGTRP